ncbi:MAG: aromatic amino acid transport family protein [Nanoarchaeota archaeon]
MNKLFWATAFTLSGTMIGAGILGLPYVFSKSGFLVGIFWVFFLGLITLYVNLCLGEITLRTKQPHQIPGYAELYLGKWGKRFMMFAMFFGIYAALLAYLIGEGQSLSKLFTGGFEHSILFAIGFWFMMTLFLKEGIDGLKKFESRGVLMITAIIFFTLLFFSRNIDASNLTTYNLSFFLYPFGVVMFALLGFSSIPEMRIVIMKKEFLLKKAIVVGTIFPLLLYAIFTMTFLGAFGKSVTEVATLSFGNFVPVLGVFTMFASYFVLSFSLNNIFELDLKRKDYSFLFVSLVPLILYIFVELLNLADFVNIIAIGGVVSGGLTIILILLIQMKAKKKGNRKPEFSVPMNWILLGILATIFISGMVSEAYNYYSLLVHG